MRAMIAAELRGRWPRTIALAAGLVLSAGSFALFSATAKTEQLQVHGTVARVFRSSYDLLVRPARSSTPIERSEGLVRDNFLSGIFGGITMDQYRQIAQLPGVAVAAPIAMIGYVLQPVEFHVDLTRFLHGRRHALFAVRVQRTTDAGHVHLLDQTGYVYVTRNPLTTPALSTGANEQESLPGGHVAHVCPINGLNHVSSPFGTGERGIVDCWSLVTGADANGLGWAYSGFRRGHVGATIDWPYPLLLAAIDPTAEARLVGLSRAIVSGRYLRNGDVPTVVSYANGGRLDLPVLVSSRPYGDDTDTVTVRAYGAATTRAMLHASTVRAAARVTAGPQAPVLVRRTFGVAQAYANLLRTVTHQQYAAIDSYWSASPTRYRQLGVRELTPIPTRTPHRTWRSDWMGTGYVDAPIDASMTGFRRLHAYPAILPQTNAVNYPVLHAVGHFDPARLPGFSSLSRLPQETYYPPTAAPADARTRALLHGRDLLPDANPAGYLQPPPLLLTDLNSLPAFSDPSVFPTADASAPISVIRVRVADVHGDDPVSRERVRLAAQRIVQATGLQVDVTIGSSPTPVRIDLPGGSGRPALTLSEGWIKKGVSVSILDAIDRQSQILFALILLVGAVFTANAVSAAVRVRRAELGVLAAVGWDRRHLFGLLMGELAVLSLGAGVTGGLLALGLGAALQDRWDPATAALAVPAAMAIALLAGIGPALRAS